MGVPLQACAVELQHEKRNEWDRQNANMNVRKNAGEAPKKTNQLLFERQTGQNFRSTDLPEM